MKKGSLILLTLLMALMGCSKQEPVSKPTPEPVQTEEVPVKEETQAPAFKYTTPLTGIGTNEELPKRAVMVMVNNAPQARPQSGLDKADIVYEILAEGGITRFVAIYHSQKPEVIGPVRSIRPYLIDIGSGFDAIMVHAGGSPEALNTLSSQGMAHLDEIRNAGGYFWREKFRKAPHNLYTNIDNIWKASQKLGFREEAEIPSLSFADENQQPAGTPALKIEAQYTNQYHISYEYDEATKSYKRFTSGKPHKDLKSEQQLTAVNVLVVSTPHRILDNEGRRDVDVFGPGKGYLFQRGQMLPITWERKGGMIRAYKDGKEVEMYPGNTWVNIIPSTPSLEQAVKIQ